jgi:hypothetical protein
MEMITHVSGSVARDSDLIALRYTLTVGNAVVAEMSVVADEAEALTGDRPMVDPYDFSTGRVIGAVSNASEHSCNWQRGGKVEVYSVHVLTPMSQAAVRVSTDVV